MRFSMILEMVDKLSGPARRARAGVGGLANTARQMGQRVRQAAGELQRGERSMSGFARTARRAATVGIGRMLQNAARSARQMDRNLASLVTRLRLVERAGFATGRGIRNLAGGAAGLLKSGIFAGGAAVAAAGGFALFDLFRTAGQFEQYQIQLEGIEGSAKAAKSAMAWVTEFAKVTPYELDEVMEAFASLKTFGLDPMDGSLRAMGDAASAMNKPIMAAIEMLTDATTGEFERLKEFGIKARKEGDRTTFHYIKNNKKMQRTVSGDELETKRALVDIFADRFGGGMERQSKTMFGIISNLKGMWTEFLLMISNAGVFDWIKSRLQKVLDLVNDMAANGKLEEWSKKISDNLIKAFEWAEKFVMETDWEAVGRGLAKGVEALVKMIELLGKATVIARDIATNDGVFVTKDKRELPEQKSDPWTIFKFKDKPTPKPAQKAPAARKLSSNFTGSSGGAVNVGGTLKIDVNNTTGLAVRATPKATPGSPLSMEVHTGKTMRSAA